MTAKETMRRKATTFFWATRFFPADVAKNISILYAFCRYVDDLVDVKQESCQQVQRDLRKKHSNIEQVQAFLRLTSHLKMSLEPAYILLNTIEKDRKGIKIKTWEELLRYCYGVASTVGLMMCDIFGVQNKNAYPFAIDLGIGMQLTNIARDIYEDAIQGKIYLPQEAFNEEITIGKIIQDQMQEPILNVRKQLLQLADCYYRSADNGMHFLPKYARLGILIASRLYQAKGHPMLKYPLFYLKNRADISILAKIYHTTRSMISFCFDSTYMAGNQTHHDASLHRDLFSLPGTYLS